MMSALECFEKATRCEALAGECDDPEQSSVLREIAEHWRTLGRAAKAVQSRVMGSVQRHGGGDESV
jgi:hypothetical protein